MILYQISQAEHEAAEVAEAAKILAGIKDKADETVDEDLDDHEIEGSTRSPSFSPGTEGGEAGSAPATSGTRRIHIGRFDPLDASTHDAIAACCRNGDYVTGLPYANGKRTTVSVDELRRSGHPLVTKVLVWERERKDADEGEDGDEEDGAPERKRRRTGPSTARKGKGKGKGKGKETGEPTTTGRERTPYISPPSSSPGKQNAGSGFTAVNGAVPNEPAAEDVADRSVDHTDASRQPAQSRRRPARVTRAPAAAATAAVAEEGREEQVTAHPADRLSDHAGAPGQPGQSRRRPARVARAPAAAATAAVAEEGREEQVTTVTTRGRKVHMPKKFGE